MAIILNFHNATHVFPVQNESYQESPEKTKNNVEHRDNIHSLVC